jgi:signal transduction histidine kinase
LVLALCLCSLLVNLWAYSRSAPLPLLILWLNLATLAVVGLQQWRSRKSIKFQPQELADRLLQVQENERHRLSRELHDDIGQLLTAAKLQSEWLKRRVLLRDTDLAMSDFRLAYIADGANEGSLREDRSWRLTGLYVEYGAETFFYT